MKKARTKALRELVEIAQAGLQCFLRGGYRLTQMAHVADEMDVSAGTIYRYVASKEALFYVSALHAAHAPINHFPTPVTVRGLDDAIRVIHTMATEWRDWPHLRKALATKRPADVRAEAEEIGLELFDRLSNRADFIGLMNRCAHDIPALAHIFNDEIKGPYLADVSTWFERRSGVTPQRDKVSQAAIARAGAEAISWLAMVRPRDPTAHAIDDAKARSAAAAVFTNLLSAEATNRLATAKKKRAVSI
jgi:AcrR family transcriptional regulator